MNRPKKQLYIQYKPHKVLEHFIDAFWIANGKDKMISHNKIMPDGCVDIILNLGPEFKTDNQEVSMKTNQAYLVGTMTYYKEIIRPGGINLIGIRFKPGAFTSFYNHSFLNGVSNKTIEFDNKLIPQINEDTKNPLQLLNNFFIDKLTLVKEPILEIIDDIKINGQINVDALAKRHSISNRQLERYFIKNLDVSPKEFINFTRCKFALEKIRNNPMKRSLLDIAFESGYYDHSHLSNEIKKHTGTIPSEY
jgi:AraC-like DNA-binding protein